MTPARPGLRPMRALPMLEARREALEKCVFCPKLCRSACPVSNAEPRETITPWGKMTLAWMAAHGDVPIDASHGAPAWACTGCRACRESCDHRNEVADVLLDARSSLLGGGAAPAAALRVRQRFAAHEERTRAAARRIARHPSVRVGSPDVLLVGCGYLRAARAEATAGVDAAAALAGGPVSIFDGCCGLPLRLAGDRDAFARHARAVSDALRGRERLVVIDAGCALALRRAYGDVGVALRTRVELLVDLAARSLSSLAPIGDGGGLVRWHDPCQLGRGLGVYEAPRAVLTRLLGRPPDEFEARREGAACSGGGGLLPATMPATARAIGDARLASHAESGGGRVVTACASSLLALRRARASGAGAAAQVDDLVSWIARGCRGPRGALDRAG